MTRRASPAGVRFRWGWTLRLAMMDLRRHRHARLLGAAAFAVATLAALGCVLSARALGEIDRSGTGEITVELVAFLRDDVPAAARDRLATVLERLPGVAAVRRLSGEEALAHLRTELGDRAPVLDGVEEGFLPATLEVSLRGGASGGGQADAIAWRLRRMDGVADVDVLRTSADARLAQARLRGHRLGQLGFAAAVVTLLLALLVAAVAHRLRGNDRVLFSSLGFTTAGVAWPVAIASASSAAVGMLVGLLLTAGIGAFIGRLGAEVASPWSGMSLRWPPTWAWRSGGGASWLAIPSGLAIAMVMGGALGWLGVRPTRRDVEDLAFTD